MNSSQLPNSRLISWLRAIPKAASAIVILVACLVLVGWMLDIQTLKSVLPGWVTMKANTAIAFLLSGASLWSLHKQQIAQPRHRLAQLCAFTVALIGLVTLSQYLFNWDLSIDQLVFRETPYAVATSHLGRMAPSTALNFILIGSALLFLSVRSRRCDWPIQLLTLTAVWMAWQPLLGYAYGVESLYRIASYTPMALHTAMTFIVLCVGILSARSDGGLMRIVTSSSAGGFIARRLLLLAIAFPSVLGYLILQGQQAGIYDSPFGLSLFVTLSIIVFAVWIWQNAETLDQIDTHRQRVQEALRESEKRFRRLVESNIFGVGFSDFKGGIHYANDYLLKMTGYQREEMLAGQMRWDQMTPVEFQHLDVRAAEELREYGVCTPFEKEFIRKDGTRIPLLIGAALLQEPYNQQQDIIAFCLDLSERQQAASAAARSAAAIANLNQDLQRRVSELQTLFEVIPIGIAIAQDPKCRQVRVNPAFAQLLNISPDGNASINPPSDTPEPPFKIFRNGRELSGDQLPMQYAAAKGTGVQDAEIDIVREDGAVFNLFGYAAPLFDEQGNPRGAISAFLDITERKRAEVALRESEGRFRRLVESNIFGVAFGDFSGKIYYTNDYFLTMVGYSRQDLVSGQMDWTQMTPPEFLHLDARAAEELRSHGIATPFEKEYIRKDGKRVPILIGGAMLQEPYDQQQELAVFYIDITERKRNQTLLATQTCVLEMIATGAALPEVLQVLARLIEEQSDEALCAILLMNQEGTMLGESVAPSIPETYKNVANQGVPVGACSGSCGTAAYRREPVIVSDIATDPLWADARQLALSHGLHACWSMPIFGSNGDVLGTFAMYYQRSRSPSSEDWHLVEVSTHLAGIAIERQRAESALRESEERFRKFFEDAPIGISVVDLDGKFLRVNKTFCEMLGYTEPELYQFTFAAVTHPEDVDTDLAYVEQLFNGEIPNYHLEKRYIKKNGESLWINLTSTRITDPEGKVRYGMGMVEDISDRKRVQEALSETNQTLQALIQACPLAITVFSLDNGRVKMWNPAAEQIFGWSEQEVLGRFLPSIPEDKQQEFLANLDVVRQGEALRGVETRRHKKNGSAIDISVWACPVQDAQGEINCMSIIADISDRKRTEAALKESEERFRKLTEKVRVIPWEAELATGRFTYVGPQTLEILGYPFSDWYTDNFWANHIHPDDREWAINYCVEHSAILDNYEFEYRMLTADGRVVWLYDIVNVVRSQEEPSLLRGFMIDITERKRAEQEREQLLTREQTARAEAETANRMKDEFLATLSHELRTPLNAMLGWTQLLRTRKFDEATAARALETIDRNTKALAALIEDVLDVSRIIRGKLHLNVRPVELISLIEAAIDTVRPAATLKEIQIESVLDPAVGVILADGNRLQQVVWNLLSNAVKFTPKGGRVEVRLERRTDVAANTSPYVQIQVNDTGKGISPKFLPYVFDRFSQENGSTTRSHGGLGLGLAIVRHLVELHGGTVYADSPGEGQGTSFSVQLPLAAVLEQESNQSVVEATVEEQAPLDSLPVLDGLRVLVVDDEADARELVMTILKQYGVEVTAVATAREALEVLQQLQPNVLVSDIGMPDEDGYALIRQVRALDAEQGGQIPAVALTAYARAEERIRALASGFQLHIPKPVNPEELAAVVANLVGRTGKA